MIRLGLLVSTLLMASQALWAKPEGHERQRPIDAVIVHSLGGPDCHDGVRTFQRVEGDARFWVQRFRTLPIVSIHYVIGRDGDVQAGVPESRAATHAIGWNQRSIGIELVNNADGTAYQSNQFTTVSWNTMSFPEASS